jgi:hypothetical protein
MLALVHVAIIDMLKLVALRLYTQADTTLHVRTHNSADDTEKHRLKQMAQTEQAGTESVL